VKSLQAMPVPPPDKSLTLKQLRRAGLPAPVRNWLASDYTAAAEVLATIAQKEQFPRCRSQRSGAASERITAEASLNVYRDETIPVNTVRRPVAQFSRHARAAC
jgi:hypothetical protein